QWAFRHGSIKHCGATSLEAIFADALRPHARPAEPREDLEKSMSLACGRDQLAYLNVIVLV
ncbi:MAG: hypothetical protein ACREVJ_15950, partial [Gammaproteobacteria bacterium]